jgi:cysteine synthase B
VLTDPTEGSDGARVVAQIMAAEQPERFHFVDQYSNPANWQAHYKGTGPELIRQTEGRITHFVAGLGTGGSMVGTGRFLRQQNSAIELIAVQPDGPIHGMEGLKHYRTSMVPEIFDASIPDKTLHVSTEAAYEMTRKLARHEGLFVGVSAGAAVVAALEVAGHLSRASVVVLLPDSGHRYLDEAFWEAVGT